MSEITREMVEEFRTNVVWYVHELHGPILLALIAAWEREQETCKWTWWTKTGVWRTGCGKVGVTRAPYHTFCPYCGRRIEEVKEATHAD